MNCHFNYTVETEWFGRTKQVFRISFMPFRWIPLQHHFSWIYTDATASQTFNTRLSSYLRVLEVHTTYYSNWRNCGNTFANFGSHTSNMQNAFVDWYCGYNTETETYEEDLQKSGTYYYQWLQYNYAWEWNLWNINFL